jgi:hypothetical protein
MTLNHSTPVLLSKKHLLITFDLKNRKTLWSFRPKLVNELGNRIDGNLDSALKLPDSLHKWLLCEYHQQRHTQPFPVSLAPLIYEGQGFLSVSMLY